MPPPFQSTTTLSTRSAMRHRRDSLLLCCQQANALGTRVACDVDCIGHVLEFDVTVSADERNSLRASFEDVPQPRTQFVPALILLIDLERGKFALRAADHFNHDRALDFGSFVISWLRLRNLSV